jgi:3alpha(or 20beta)-hydroxysteroid dehydrogenase
VLVTDVLDNDGQAVAEKLGDSAHFVHLDVAAPDQWDQAVDATGAEFVVDGGLTSYVPANI